MLSSPFSIFLDLSWPLISVSSSLEKMQGITDAYLQRDSLDTERLIAKLEQAKQATWSINSRESTPEIFYEPNPDSDLNYWKSIALKYGSTLQTLDKGNDHRKSIRTTSYWKTEAEHLRREFWALAGRPQCDINIKMYNRPCRDTQNGFGKNKQTASVRNKQTEQIKNKDHSTENEEQGPISSRLRKRRPATSNPCNRTRVGPSRSGFKVEKQKYSNKRRTRKEGYNGMPGIHGRA